ncbi:MAG: hypothetical protein H6714_10160 [Myxococcales bacterium]|nr:hypothetical protein [Myxococcales bacterium]
MEPSLAEIVKPRGPSQELFVLEQTDLLSGGITQPVRASPKRSMRGARTEIVRLRPKDTYKPSPMTPPGNL